MEFYIRTQGDPNFNPASIDVESELGMALMQLETILFTKRGEVMGDPGFGVNLEDLIYSLNYNEDEIKSTIQQQIEIYSPLVQKYNPQILVSFYKGSVRDIAQIDIELDGAYRVGVYVN